MRPDPPLDAMLRPVMRRLRLAAMAWAFAAGLATTAIAALALAWQAPVLRFGVAAAAGLAATAFTFGQKRRTLSRTHAAAAAERSHPAFQNLLVTAEELDAYPERAAPWIRERVIEDARARSDGFDAASAVPLRSSAAAVVGAAALAAIALGINPGRPGDAVTPVADRLALDPSGSGRAGLTVEIDPPPYTGLPPRVEQDPDSLDVVGGTRLRVRVAGTGRVARMRLGTRPLEVRAGEGELVAELVARESTYLALETDRQEETRLVPLRVAPDRVPAVRIEAPARDLLLPPGAEPIAVTASARDDYGLDRLEIRYTKVSGSGEQFEFEEGTLPVRLTRAGPREWTAAGTLPLDRLKLEPGDSVVYRAVARDARPGSEGVAESDTFFVEIQGRSGVVLEGLEMPPEQERYALSQQMVVMKIERLRGREKQMAPEDVREEAALIAAEQRMVRANFIFLLGGHVEDEVAEAEHSHEIQEGRLENTARQEISRAIYLMTASETGLTAVDTAQALPPARAAVQALQLAFGRNRYLLRSLAVASRIDPSRRLTGKLDGAGDWRRRQPDPDDAVDGAEARALLSAILAATTSVASGADAEAANLAALAEQALAWAPETSESQEAASAILSAREALARHGNRDDALARLRDAARPVAAAAQARARPPNPAGSAAPDALERAWAGEARR